MEFTIRITRRRLALAATALVTIVALTACDDQSGQDNENEQQDKSTAQLVNGQPLPQFKYSQARQNLIELETAQAQGVQTTTFFFNEGVQEPISSCPSVGVPMPNTASLSNPLRRDYETSIGQMDPTGVYVPEDSNGTYVICLDATGNPYAQYWEGNVQTLFGPAAWNKSTHAVELTGPSSFKFSKQQGK